MNGQRRFGGVIAFCNIFILIVIPSLFCLIAFSRADFFRRGLNSDTLMPADYFWDLAHHSDAWRFFQLPRIPSLFPDLLIHGILQRFTGSWRVAYIGFAICTLTALVCLSGAIVNRISRCGWSHGTASFLLLAIPVLGLETFSFHILHLNIVLPASHGGPFVLALAALYVFERGLTAPSFRTCALLFLLVAAGVMSDKLVFVAFHIAACGGIGLSLVMRRLNTSYRKLLLVVGVVVLATVLGLVVDKGLVRQPDLAFSFGDIRQAAVHFLHSPLQLFSEEPWTMLSCILLPIMLAFVLIVRDLVRPSLSAKSMDVPTFWIGAATSSALASLVAVTFVYQDLGSYRYLTPTVWWPLILSAALIARWLARIPVFVLGIASVLSVVSFAMAAPLDGPTIPSFMTYRDPLTACLLQHKAKAGLQRGIAGYWLARYVTALSDWQVSVDQVKDDGVAYYWENDPRWYRYDFDDRRQPAPYNFIVLVVPRAPVNPDGRATIMPDEVRTLFGTPNTIFACQLDAGAPPEATHAEIWLYDDVSHIRTVLDAHSCDLYPGTHRRVPDKSALPACIK